MVFGYFAMSSPPGQEVVLTRRHVELSVAVVREDFVLKVPMSLQIERAAPILCAGVTTYSTLKH